jgi:hypothetical protein
LDGSGRSRGFFLLVGNRGREVVHENIRISRDRRKRLIGKGFQQQG